MGGAFSKFNLNAFKQRYMFPCSIQISVFYLQDDTKLTGSYDCLRRTDPILFRLDPTLEDMFGGRTHRSCQSRSKITGQRNKRHYFHNCDLVNIIHYVFICYETIAVTVLFMIDSIRPSQFQTLTISLLFCTNIA